MKPQSIEYLLDCYVKEKNSCYDVVDGVRRHGRNYESLAGETSFDLDDRCNELQFMFPQGAEPVVESIRVQPHHVPLSPEMEERTKQFARQLIVFSDEFEFTHSSCYKSQSSGSNGIEFKDHSIFVSADSNLIKISVVRKDAAEHSVKAKWKTHDKTAKSGIHFVGSEGDVLFKEGELESIIEITLLENNDNGLDKRFQVELFDPEGNAVGKSNYITVNICDQANLYDDDRQVIENIKRIGPCANINSVASCLLDKVNSRTFHAALQCLCATAVSYQEELALAFELTRIALPKARKISLSKVVSDFFRYLPELEEILQ